MMKIKEKHAKTPKRGPARAKQSKYTKSARNRECTIRIPEVCNWDAETSVLAHLNGGGMGAKRDDRHGAIACSACHDEVDRRTRRVSAEYAKLCHLEGVVRTQELWISEGLM